MFCSLSTVRRAGEPRRSFSPHAYGVHRALRPLRPLVTPVLEFAYKRRLEKCLNIADLRRAAERRMPRMCFGYLDSGADDEVSLRRNKDAFGSYELHYHVLSHRAPEDLDLSTTLLGSEVKLPILTCPCAGQRMFHTEGEVAVACVAAERGVAYSLSTLATSTPAEVAAVNGSQSKIFQLYLWKDRALVRDMIAQAKEAGFTALALTADLTYYGNRERDLRQGFTIPPSYSPRQILDAAMAPAWTFDHLSTDNYTYSLLDRQVPAEALSGFIASSFKIDFTWDDAAWILSEWTHGPVALKGVVRPDDAARAVDCGFDAVWLSNHGGRQLDGSPAAVDVLPAVRAAVGPDVEIIVDGGIQRGTDILKALALGADGVGIGKPFLYGLGAGGKRGVERCFDILHSELQRDLGLLGVASIAELKRRGPDLVKRRFASPRDAQGARYAPSQII